VLAKVAGMVAFGCDLVGALAGLRLEFNLSGVDDLARHVLDLPIANVMDERDLAEVLRVLDVVDDVGAGFFRLDVGSSAVSRFDDQISP
jgi:hypothetical protein